MIVAEAKFGSLSLSQTKKSCSVLGAVAELGHERRGGRLVSISLALQVVILRTPLKIFLD